MSTQSQLEDCVEAISKRIGQGKDDWIVTLKTLSLWHALLGATEATFGKVSFTALPTLEGCAFFMDTSHADSAQATGRACVECQTSFAPTPAI